MFVAMIGLLATHSLLSPSRIVIAVQCSAFALMLWARATFGLRSLHAGGAPTAGGLVTTGPYRFMRHPIYTAACLFGWAGIVANWSLIAALLGALLILAAIGRMLCEERLVTEMYPSYREYADATKRMLPYVF